MSEQEEKYQVGRVAWEIGNAQVRREYPALPMVTWDDLGEEDKATLDAQMRKKIAAEQERASEQRREARREYLKTFPYDRMSDEFLDALFEWFKQRGFDAMT